MLFIYLQVGQPQPVFPQVLVCIGQAWKQKPVWLSFVFITHMYTYKYINKYMYTMPVRPKHFVFWRVKSPTQQCFRKRVNHSRPFHHQYELTQERDYLLLTTDENTSSSAFVWGTSCTYWPVGKLLSWTNLFVSSVVGTELLSDGGFGTICSLHLGGPVWPAEKLVQWTGESLSITSFQV